MKNNYECSYFVYANVANGKFQYCLEILTLFQAFNGAVTVYGQYGVNVGKPPLYWLHSLVLVIMTSFSGGIITPMLLGKPSGLVANDTLLPIAIIAWYSVHYLGLYKVFTWAPVRALHQPIIAMYRVHSVIRMVNIANAVLPHGSYYTIPQFGPIVTGTITGCIGTFVTSEKFFAPIHEGSSWAL